MFNPNAAPTISASNAIIRIEPCGFGTKIVFSDNEALDSYVDHVQGIADRRILLPNGKYLQGEVEEQDGYEVSRMVTYPWLRLAPAN